MQRRANLSHVWASSLLNLALDWLPASGLQVALALGRATAERLGAMLRDSAVAVGEFCGCQPLSGDLARAANWIDVGQTQGRARRTATVALTSPENRSTSIHSAATAENGFAANNPGTCPANVYSWRGVRRSRNKGRAERMRTVAESPGQPFLPPARQRERRTGAVAAALRWSIVLGMGRVEPREGRL